MTIDNRKRWLALYHLAFVFGALFAPAASVAGAVLLRTPREPAPAAEPALADC